MTLYSCTESSQSLPFNTTLLGQLPKELIQYIISFVSASERNALALTCKDLSLMLPTSPRASEIQVQMRKIFSDAYNVLEFNLIKYNALAKRIPFETFQNQQNQRILPDQYRKHWLSAKSQIEALHLQASELHRPIHPIPNLSQTINELCISYMKIINSLKVQVAFLACGKTHTIDHSCLYALKRWTEELCISPYFPTSEVGSILISSDKLLQLIEQREDISAYRINDDHDKSESIKIQEFEEKLYDSPDTIEEKTVEYAMQIVRTIPNRSIQSWSEHKLVQVLLKCGNPEKARRLVLHIADLAAYLDAYTLLDKNL